MSGRKKGKRPPVDERRPTDEERKSLSSWKFDLLEICNADPQTTPYELAVLEAYAHYVTADSRTAYLSALDLRVRTGMLAVATIWKSRKLLVSLGYFTFVGKTRSGCDVFRIANPRQNIVLDHMTEAQTTLREMDAERKRRDREKAKAKADVHSSGERTSTSPVHSNRETTAPSRPLNRRMDVHSSGEYKHLEGTPRYPDSSEGEARSQDPSMNEYLRAKGGY